MFGYASAHPDIQQPAGLDAQNLKKSHEETECQKLRPRLHDLPDFVKFWILSRKLLYLVLSCDKVRFKRCQDIYMRCLVKQRPKCMFLVPR